MLLLMGITAVRRRRQQLPLVDDASKLAGS
jgi:hypothetical protein